MTSLESRCVALKPLPNDTMTAILPINFAYAWKNAFLARSTIRETRRHPLGTSVIRLAPVNDSRFFVSERIIGTEKCKIERETLRHIHQLLPV